MWEEVVPYINVSITHFIHFSKARLRFLIHQLKPLFCWAQRLHPLSRSVSIQTKNTLTIGYDNTKLIRCPPCDPRPPSNRTPISEIETLITDQEASKRIDTSTIGNVHECEREWSVSGLFLQINFLTIQLLFFDVNQSSVLTSRSFLHIDHWVRHPGQEGIHSRFK